MCLLRPLGLIAATMKRFVICLQISYHLESTDYAIDHFLFKCFYIELKYYHSK